MKTIIVSLLLSIVTFTGWAANLTPHTKVYLVTMGPGDELYSGFGHSAIWFQDSTLQMDRVYNYGTFDFAPDFYVKFVRGKLDYMLSVHAFHYLIEDATEEQRYLLLQELDLSPLQKEKLFEILEINFLPENRYYRYDFFYDNCSSRLRDVVANACGDSLKYDLSENRNLSFRQLINLFLYDKRFQDLGMDIGLGAPADMKATPLQYMFLPEFLKAGFDKATLKTSQGWKPLVKKEVQVYEPAIRRDREPFNFTLYFCWAFGALVVVYSIFCFRKVGAGIWFDITWLVVTGLLGLLLIFLWFFTDHKVTASNYDLLWALPTHLLAAVLIKGRSGKWLWYYLIACSFCCLILLLGWPICPEEMNPAVFPLVLLTLVRLLKLVYDRWSGRNSV